MNKAVKNYQQAQVTTVGNGEVVILLYEGAIRFLTQAKEKIAEKDYATKGMLISRAMDIVHELDNSLNMEKGGEIAKNLHGLYVFASTTLLRANIKLDCEMIDSVIHILSELKWSFEHIVNTPEAKAAEEEIRQSKTTSTFVARAVTSAPTSGVGKSAANSAYNTVAKNAGVDLGQTNTAPQNNAVTQASVGQKQEVSAEMVSSFLAQKAGSVETANAMQGQGTQESAIPTSQTITKTANPFTLNQGIAKTGNEVKTQNPLINNIANSGNVASNTANATASHLSPKPMQVGARDEEKVLKNPLLTRGLNK